MTDLDSLIKCRAMADLILSRALQLMHEEGIPFAVMVDRMMTCAAVHVASTEGAGEAVALFRSAAARIDAGALSAHEGQPQRH